MTCCDWTGKNIFQSAGGGVTPAGNPVFDNIAALAAFRVEPSQNGLVVWVLSVQDAFQYQNDSEIPPDGITVVAPTAADSIGNWIRLQIPNERWAQQLAWYIRDHDSSDENDGATQDTPLATHAELARRINGLTLRQPTVITIMSDLQEVLRLDVTLGESDPVGTITYIGMEQRPFLRESSGAGMTNVTALDPAINVALSFFDAAFANWSGDGTDANPSMIGRRIRITTSTTSSHEDAAAWLAKEIVGSVQQVRSSPFYGVDATIIVPSGGDQYVVEKQMRVPGFDLMLRRRRGGEPVCVIQNLALTRSDPSLTACSTRLRSDGGEARFVIRDCHIDSPILEIERGNIENCLLTSTSDNIVLVGKSILFRAGLTLNHGYVIDTPMAVAFHDHHLVQGDGGLGMVLRVPVVDMNGLAFFDCNPALVIHNGGAVRVGFHDVPGDPNAVTGSVGLWGDDNGQTPVEGDPPVLAGVAVVIEAGASLVYDSPGDGTTPGPAPVIDVLEDSNRYSVGNVNIGGDNDAQDPPFLNQNNGAALVNRRIP